MAKKVPVKKATKRGRKKKTEQEIREAIETKIISIKSTIESGNLRKLKDIEHLFTKAMADDMGLNHGRFIDKLKNPIKFSMTDLFKFALYINVKPSLLIQQVTKEIEDNKEVIAKLQKRKS